MNIVCFSKFAQMRVVETVFPRAVLFDWDGTLAETRPAVVDAMEHTLAAYGREPWDETKRKYRDTSKSLKENFPNFFGEESVRAYDDYLAYYRVHGMRRIVPAPGAADFLRSCINAGVGIYVVSNKEKALLTAEVRHFFPDIVFNAVLGNGDAPRNKPAPDPVFAALKNADFAINRETVWLVGDSKQDTDCALAAGVLPVVIGNGKFMGEGELAQYAAAGKVKCFSDFAALYRQMCRG